MTRTSNTRLPFRFGSAKILIAVSCLVAWQTPLAHRAEALELGRLMLHSQPEIEVVWDGVSLGKNRLRGSPRNRCHTPRNLFSSLDRRGLRATVDRSTRRIGVAERQSAPDDNSLDDRRDTTSEAGRTGASTDRAGRCGCTHSSETGTS